MDFVMRRIISDRVAIWQLGTRQMNMEARINQLETALLDAGMDIPQLEM